jgi:hypothetical protein
VRPSARQLLIAAALVLVAGRLGGDAAALTTVQLLAAVALLSLLVELPVPARPRRPPPAETDGRDRFASYDRVVSAVLSSRQSARVVDLQLRPVLDRLVATKVDQLGEARVRAVLGEDVWWLADPRRPARSDSREGGLETADLTRVVERLEAL